jgi:hypothetical protein
MEDDRSSSWPLFEQSARDLAAKLGDSPKAEAAGMAREARELALVFKSWEKARPENTTRIARIRELFELNRRAMDFMSKQARASVPTPAGGTSAKTPPSSRRTR